MPTFTCITENRGSAHLTQHDVPSAEEALRKHVGKLPYDDGDDIPNDEIDWLIAVSDGTRKVVLIPCSKFANVWLWRDGADHEPRYCTYIVKTDVK
jgi:hypothetical protein